MAKIVGTRIASAPLGLALLAALASPALATSDMAFLVNAIHGDNSEVLLGQMALDKPTSPKMKQFAEMLVRDHGQHRKEASALAQQMGMVAPSAATSSAGEEAVKLQRLDGEAFEQELAAYMVRDHNKDILQYRTEAESGRGPVRQFAEKSLPVLESHLQMAQSLRDGH